ncbi:hypothetical protein BD779DRAFT_1477707 [Infundibulicybe gibba]|nr:hypothetical protein BD779DRAFT_1477707 [Infundibulicybe gibba]
MHTGSAESSQGTEGGAVHSMEKRNNGKVLIDANAGIKLPPGIDVEIQFPDVNPQLDEGAFGRGVAHEQRRTGEGADGTRYGDDKGTCDVVQNLQVVRQRGKSPHRSLVNSTYYHDPEVSSFLQQTDDVLIDHHIWITMHGGREGCVPGLGIRTSYAAGEAISRPFACAAASFIIFLSILKDGKEVARGDSRSKAQVNRCLKNSIGGQGNGIVRVVARAARLTIVFGEM